MLGNPENSARKINRTDPNEARSLSEWFKCHPVRATDLRLLRVHKGGPPKEQLKNE